MSSLYNITKEATPPAALNFIPTANDPIALLYMPWGSATRGSIAIGILKECAKQIGVKTDVHYLNIKFAEKIGLELYESISEASAFFPEWFFSSVLFGPQGLVHHRAARRWEGGSRGRRRHGRPGDQGLRRGQRHHRAVPRRADTPGIFCELSSL